MDNTINMDRKPLIYTFNDLGQSLLENVFPKRQSCLFCGSFWYGNKLSAGLCPHCLLKWGRFRQQAKICPMCGSFDGGEPCQGPCAEYHDQHLTRMGSLEAIIAASPYTAVYRQRTLAFKYNGLKMLAAPFAYLMSIAWRGSEAGRHGAAQFSYSGSRAIPCLVPVPLHRDKEALRGYNQSRLLAEAIYRECGFPVKDLLIRPFAGQMQAGLDKRQRQQALAKVYQWSNQAENHRGPVILIDDVVTTGATLESCGQILQERGFGPIWGLTFAGGSGMGADGN